MGKRVRLADFEDVICEKIVDCANDIVKSIEKETGSDFNISSVDIEDMGYQSGELPEVRDTIVEWLGELGIQWE